MSDLLFRMRVAVLWVAVAVALSGSLLLGLLGPGALEELLAGEMEGQPLDDATRFLLTALVIFPLVMAGVTLLVRDRVNRLVNVVAGLSYGLLGVYAAGLELLGGHFDEHVVMALTASALVFLIAGLGLAGMRRPTSTTAARGGEQGRPGEEATV